MLEGKHSISVFDEWRFMVNHHIVISAHSTPYTYLFKACSLTNNVDLTKALHNSLLKSGIEFDKYIQRALVTTWYG